MVPLRRSNVKWTPSSYFGDKGLPVQVKITFTFIGKVMIKEPSC